MRAQAGAVRKKIEAVSAEYPAMTAQVPAIREKMVKGWHFRLKRLLFLKRPGNF